MTLTHFIAQIRRRATLNNVVLMLACLIAIGWLWGTVVSLQKNFALQKEVDALQRDIQIAEIENATLQFARQYYGSNEYLELRARQYLNKALPGEHLVFLPAAPKIPAVSPAQDRPASPDDTSNFQQWMRFFFGNGS